MTPRETEAERIFLQAIDEHAPREWLEFVQTACGGDSELCNRVHALLKAYAKPNPLLEGGFAATLDQPPVEKLGTYIDRYKLVHEIGQGGMGVVYMAVQKEPVKRKVALKIIKPGMDTREVVARFEAERQALALMDHQCIAHVLDGGSTPSGRPYFVMELVDGTPITEYCDAARFTTRQRLDLFVKVCQAVQHAHLKGVIHRDIKPSNILVTHYDAAPVPKVIDFGIAKAVHQPLTDASVYTQVAQMVGTPLYMSPEQAERTGQDVDTRTDVYSLGVLLYELLTGTTPFDRERLKNSGLEEVKRIIREEEPPKPSTRLSTLGAALDTVVETHHTDRRTLTNELTGELDWIVMKALEKDRSRRYESASEFSKDVQRYLDGDAVEACPPTVGYRLKKFAQKNRVALGTAATVALALLIGAGIATWQAWVATAAKRQVTKQFERAERNFATAEQNFQLAFDAVDQLLTEVAGDQLKDIPQAEQVRKALLEKALAFFETFLEQRGDDPQVRHEAAKAQMRAGDILELLGENERAEKHYREAIKAFEALSTEMPEDPENDHALAVTFMKLTDLLRKSGQQEQAKSSCQQGLKVADRLVEKAPDKEAYKSDRARMLFVSALLQHELGRFQEAEAAYREALQSAKALTATKRESRIHGGLLGDCWSGLADLLRQTGRVEEARDAYEEALETFQQVLVDAPDDPSVRSDLALVHNDYARLLRSVGDPKQSESHHAQALEIRKQLVTDFPAVPSYQEALATSYANRALAFAESGRSAEADTSLGQAMKLWQDLAHEVPDVPDYRAALAKCHNFLAHLQRESGQNKEAENNFLEATRLGKQCVTEAPGNPEYRSELAMVYNNLALLWASLGQQEQAAEARQNAMDTQRQLVAAFPAVPAYRSFLATYLLNTGDTLNNDGRADEAEPLLREALKHLETLSAASPKEVEHRVLLSKCWINLDRTLAALGRPEEAEAAARESVQISEELAKANPDNPERQYTLALGYNNLGRALANAGRIEESPVLYEKAAAIYRRLSTDHPTVEKYRSELRRTLNNDIQVRKDLGQYDQALTNLQLLIDLNLETGAAVFSRMGDLCLDGLKQYERAVAQYSKALDLSPDDRSSVLVRRAIARHEAGDEAGFQADCETLRSLSGGPLKVQCQLAAIYFACNLGQEAVAECLKVDGVTPGNAWGAVLQAGLLLLADRPDRYRDACTSALDRFAETEEPQDRIHVARCCVFAPKAVADPSQPLDLAKLGVAEQPRAQWFLHVLGMAHFRAGQLDEAESRLQESLEVDPKWHARRLNYLGLALVHHTRGELEQAQEWYVKAVPEIDGRPAAYTQSVHDWLEAQLLRREVEQLLVTPRQPTDNSSTDAEKGREVEE